MTGACSSWLSILGNNATGVRPGSGMLPLLLEGTAVVLTMSGQSAIPRGVAVSVPLGAVCNVSFRVVTGAAVLTGCVACFGFVQQLCAAAGSQVSPSITVSLDSTVSAPIACMLLQPNRQPPAIQTDTMKARRTRENLLNRADFTAAVYSEKHKSTKTLQVLCNRRIGSLIAGEHT